MPRRLLFMDGVTRSKDLKQTILVVDDSMYNRELLSEILSDTYDIVQAENGKMALEILNKEREKISCILLDISMQIVNGFEVLEYMNKHKWIQTLPVIIISSENSNTFIRRGYELGAVDYIFRPFDEMVVIRRVQNTVNLYVKQKKLVALAKHQINENERLSDMMISILGHTVEFRNKESNMHIANVSSLTKIFLQKLNENSDKYHFSKKDIALISRAAALHDLGKVSIPDEVLNKPGKLTPEEFEAMKNHTVIGSKMLESEVVYQKEPLVKRAYEICRWHHERYDGRGYPDGLSGDKIPITAQVVSIADVYDALTSQRCYKKAFSHEKAIEMINNNECGVFNPEILDCLNQLKDTLVERLTAENDAKLKNEITVMEGM